MKFSSSFFFSLSALLMSRWYSYTIVMIQLRSNLSERSNFDIVDNVSIAVYALSLYSDITFHHHHIVLAARISLTLPRHSSLSFIALGRSSGQQPVSSHSCWMYVRAGRPAFARPCVGIHKSTSLMSSSLLLQQSLLVDEILQPKWSTNFSGGDGVILMRRWIHLI